LRKTKLPVLLVHTGADLVPDAGAQTRARAHLVAQVGRDFALRSSIINYLATKRVTHFPCLSTYFPPVLSESQAMKRIEPDRRAERQGDGR
jgi:hypothetical protein